MNINVYTFNSFKKFPYIVGCLFLLASMFAGEILQAQTLNDGPIELQVKVRDFNVTYSPPSDASLNFGGQFGFQPDEFTFKIQARDNADVDGVSWQPATPQCLTADFDPPGQSQDFNYTMFNHTYTGASVPQYFDIKLDAWEDECGSDGALGNNCSGNRCDYETNCCCVQFIGCLYSDDDDRRCNADPFATQLDYRLGPPCTWYDHGYVVGSCSNNVYQPHMETFWRYTRGTGCGDPIALGALTSGGSFSHFNSNECYGNTLPGTAGNDVYYSFTISQPLGVQISLCGGVATFNTYLTLLDASCTVDTFNDDFCSARSQINASLCDPGTYYVVVSGAGAADFGTFTLDITEDPSFSFTVSIAKQDVSCTGAADGTATATASGANPPFTYQWSANAGSSTDTTVTGLSAGTYSVTATDAKGCEATASVTIIDPPLLVIDNIIVTDVTCSGVNNGSATAVVSGGTPSGLGTYNYQWSTIPVQTGNPAIGLSDGIYTVTVTDDNGCTTSQSFSVGTTNPLVVNFNEQDVSCNGADDGSVSVIPVSGGTPPFSYNWLFPGGGTDTSQNQSGLTPGTYVLTIVDDLGCNEDFTFNITEPAVLASSVVATQDVSCNGDANGAIDIEITGGTLPYGVSWNDGPSSSDRLGLSGGTYSATVTDANNCQTTLTGVVVDEPAELEIAVLDETPPTCPDASDGSIDIDVTGGVGGYQYFWSDFSTDQDLTNAPGGSYVVIVTDDNGCNEAESFSFTEIEEIDIRFAQTPISCQQLSDGAISLTVNGGTPPYQFAWSNNAATQDIAELGPGTYTVTVTDAEGCAQVDSVTLLDSPLTPQECGTQHNIAVPTAFTPNGDGQNDLLLVRRLNVANLNMKVYNRWGQLIYEMDNLPDTEGWDGRYEGKDVPVGGYTWICDVEFANGQSDTRVGTVLVVR